MQRILLQPRVGGIHVVVKHESQTTYRAMPASATQAMLRERVGPLPDGYARLAFHDIVDLWGPPAQPLPCDSPGYAGSARLLEQPEITSESAWGSQGIFAHSSASW